MKKIVFIFFAIFLLAAGCSSQKQPPAQSSTASSTPSTAYQLLSQSPVPPGAQVSYKDVLKDVAAKCGDSVQIVNFTTGRDSAGDQLDSYSFTPGTCGTSGQLVNATYDQKTQAIGIDNQIRNNANNTLQPLPLADWQINYTEAINQAWTNGGQAFVKANPGGGIKTASLVYRQGQVFRWEVIFVSAKSTTQITVYVDPKTGSIITK